MLRGTLTGLKRIDRNLYQEDSKGDQPSEWIRVVKRLDILLFDIRMIGGGLLDRHTEDARDQVAPSRRIIAAGSLEKRTIYVTVPDRTELAKGFDDVVVTLRRAGDDFEQACNRKAQLDLNTYDLPESRMLRCGSVYFFHEMDELKASKYPEIETLVPCPIFDFAWEQLASNNVTHAELSVQAEVFQERMESKLAEPWHRQDFLIESEPSDHPIEFQCLYVYSHPIARKRQDEGSE